MDWIKLILAIGVLLLGGYYVAALFPPMATILIGASGATLIFNYTGRHEPPPEDWKAMTVVGAFVFLVGLCAGGLFRL